MSASAKNRRRSINASLAWRIKRPRANIGAAARIGEKERIYSSVTKMPFLRMRNVIYRADLLISQFHGLTVLT